MKAAVTQGEQKKISWGFLADIFGNRKEAEKAVGVVAEKGGPIVSFTNSASISLAGKGHSMRLVAPNQRQINEVLAARAKGQLREMVRNTALGTMN